VKRIAVYVLALACGTALTGCAAEAMVPAAEPIDDAPMQEAAYRNSLYRACRDMGLPPNTLLHAESLENLHAHNRSNLGAGQSSVTGTILAPNTSR
jgi:hypothetical protein